MADFIPLDTSTNIPQSSPAENQHRPSQNGIQKTTDKNQLKLFLQSAMSLSETLIAQAIKKANPNNKVEKITVYKSGNSAIIECVDQETYSFLLNCQNLLKQHIANDVTIKIYNPSREERALAKPTVKLPSVVAKDVPLDIKPEQICQALDRNHHIHPVRVTRMVDKATKLETKSVRIICEDSGEVDWLLREGFSVPPLRIRCEQDKNMLRNKANNMVTQVCDDVRNTQAMRTSKPPDVEDGEITDYEPEEHMPTSSNNDFSPQPPEPTPGFHYDTNFQPSSFRGPPIFYRENDSTTNMVWSTRKENDISPEHHDECRRGDYTRRDHDYRESRHHEESRYRERRQHEGDDGDDGDLQFEDFDDQRIVLNDGLDYRRRDDGNGNNQHYNDNRGSEEYRGNGHRERYGRSDGQGHNQRYDRSPEDYRGFLQAQNHRRSSEGRSRDRESSWERNWDETEGFRNGERPRELDRGKIHWNSRRERSPHHRDERNHRSSDRAGNDGHLHREGRKSRHHKFTHDNSEDNFHSHRRPSPRYLYNGREYDSLGGRRVVYLATSRSDDKERDFEAWDYRYVGYPSI